MKQFFIISILLGLISCNNQQKEVVKEDDGLLSTDLILDGETLTGEDELTYAEITFDTNRWKFGQIEQHTSVAHTFHFENTGEQPLIISSAVGTCGCTVPTWPKEPIPPGEKGKIDVVFSSGTKEGKQSKQVKITANTKPNVTQLFVEGEILVK